MKRISTIVAAATIVTTFTASALAGPVGVNVPRGNAGNTNVRPDAATIAELQEAGQQALRDGRNANKNNPEFGRKNYEINRLIDRLNNGQQVDPAEIDKALEPVHVW